MARLDVPEGEGGDAVQVWSLRPEMGAAVNRLVDAAYNKSILPVRVREAARMRIAQLNDCSVCLAFRADKVKAPASTNKSVWPWHTPSGLPWTTSASMTPSSIGCGSPSPTRRSWI